VLPSESLTLTGTLSSVATGLIDLSSTGEIETVATEGAGDGYESRLWLGVPQASLGPTEEGGAVFAFDEPTGTTDASGASAAVWGPSDCVGLGRSGAVTDLFVDGPGVWMGAPGPAVDNFKLCPTEAFALWGLAMPVEGRMWADQLDDAFSEVSVDTSDGVNIALRPQGLDAGDLNGTGRDDLVVWNGSDVLVVLW
jgi:hypothetical protein